MILSLSNIIFPLLKDGAAEMVFLLKSSYPTPLKVKWFTAYRIKIFLCFRVLQEWFFFQNLSTPAPSKFKWSALLQTTTKQFNTMYSIVLYSFLFYSFLFHPIPFSSLLFYCVLFYSIQLSCILFCVIQGRGKGSALCGAWDFLCSPTIQRQVTSTSGTHVNNSPPPSK